MAGTPCWLPLESNPDVMNKFLKNLGLPSGWQMCDVCGLDSELLAMLPQPVVAFILLFPVSEKYEHFKSEQETKIREKGQTISDNLYYMKQVVCNACGTIALIHSVANNTDRIELNDGPLKSFLEETASLSPEERGSKLDSNVDICSTHEKSAQEGQTAAPDREAQVNYHFVTFISKDGDIYELDGRKAFPINHGPGTGDFLQDAALACKNYMMQDPENIKFNVVALTAK